MSKCSINEGCYFSHDLASDFIIISLWSLLMVWAVLVIACSDAASILASSNHKFEIMYTVRWRIFEDIEICKY